MLQPLCNNRGSSRLLRLTATPLLLLTLTIGHAWADTSTLTFTAACGGSGTADDGASWTIMSDAAESTYDATKGIHYGTGSKAVSYLSLSTSSISGTITQIVVNASGASSTSAKLNVMVGDNAFGTEKSLTSSAANYTLTGSASGTIVVAITQSSAKKALYCKSITVTYTAAASCTTNPTVTAGSNNSVTSTTATVTCSSGISSLGSAGCSISSYGFVIGTSANPTIGGSGVTKHQVGTTYTSTGVSFHKDLTGLSAETTYYVRPYATNGNGTAYGTQTSFTTPALPRYIVTLMDDGDTHTQASYGAAVTLPSRAGCSGYTFAGWTKSWVTAQTSWTTTAPTIIPAGSYTPTVNENLYPVYTKTESGGSSSYVLTAANAVTAGTYVIGITGSSGYYIATGLSGSTNVDMSVNTSTDVTLTNNAFTTLPTGGMELTFTGNNTDGFTISNSEGDKLSYSSYANRRLSFDATGKTWKVVEADSKLVLQSNNSDGYYTISQNGTNSIRGYASNTKYNTLFLFKKTVGSTISYISVPACCSDPGLAYGTGSVTKTFGDAAFTNTLTNSHSISVTYGSSDTDVATVDEYGEVTIVGAGSATITASFTGNATYCADEASYTLTVNKADITPTLSYTSTSISVGDDSSNPTIGGNPGNGAVTYAVTASSPSGCATVNASGVVTGQAVGTATITATIDASANYNGGTATANFTISAASYFSNGATVFIQAESNSAWNDNSCVKAWFNASGAGGAAQTTYWLFDATDGDAGKKLFATVVPATGNLNQVTLQRFASNCSDFWNANGTLTKSSDGGSNTFRTTGSGTSNVAWNGSGITLSLYGDPDSWADVLATFADQSNGVWTATYNNYSPANAAGESQEFKIQTNYNGWIGNTGSNNNATLSGMHVGSTYNITATLDVKDHSLVMSKEFVKGTVHFDMQGHGSQISDLTNVTADSKISAPSAPSATGYTFGGWYKEAGCTNEWNFASDEVTETMTLYAKWTVQNYSVTSTLSNVTSSPAIPASYTYTGSAANLSYTISAASGYRLPADITVSGTTYTWNAGTGVLTLTGTITGNVSISITGVQTHTVTWLSNGSDYVSPVTYDHGATLAFPAGTPSAPASCSSKTFVGWTSDSEITSETSTVPSFISAGGAVNADATYRAVFADVNGGGGATVNTVMLSDPFTDYANNAQPAAPGNTNAQTYASGITYTYSNDSNSPTRVLIDDNGPNGSSDANMLVKSGQWYQINNIPSGSASELTLTLKKSGSGTLNISTSTSNTSITSVTANEEYTISFDDEVSTFNIKFAASSNNLRIDDIEIKVKTQGTSYDNYITLCCDLKPVTSLNVSSVTANSVTLSWTAPSPTTGIDHLEVRNASTDAKIGSDITNLATTTATISGLEECTTYSYKVVSVGASCETPSSSVDATPFSGAKTVNYVYHDGATANSQFTTDCDHTTIILPTPVWALHTFQGWYTAATDGTRVGGGGDTYNPLSSPVTLHAQWTETSYVLTQTTGSHTTKGHAGTSIKSSDIASSDLTLTYSISDNGYALPTTVTISGGGIATWELGTNYTWELSADKHSATLTILQGQTISANVTITIEEQARYTVTLDEHGSTTTQYYADDDNLFIWGDIDGCGEKLFYGWTTDAVFTEDDDTPPTCVLTKSTETINSTRTYYAIYADAVVPQNPGYEKVTTISAGTYLIATDKGSSDQVYTGKVAGQNYGGHTDVTVTAGLISTKPNNAVEVTITLGTGVNEGKFAIDDGTYWLSSPSSNELTFTANSESTVYDWNLTNDGYIHSNGNNTRYLMYNAGSPRFACYTGTQQYAYLYKKQTTTYSNFTKSCSLHDITITTPSGGTVTTTPTAGADAAGVGQTVTVTATPNSCKYLSALSYNDGSDDYDILSTRSFTMPDADVTITATFADKTVSAIAPNTDSHRALMQGSAFEGEQIRVTYNSGETEDLEWDDSRLAFSGCNMSTLGSQTVTVTYTGCGTTSTTYSVTVMDGVPVTFHDAGEVTVVKYDLNDPVNVESRSGRFATTCSGWEFAGWSETEVAANSTTFTPVYNFNATMPKTLYAVYSKVGSTWLSAYDISEMRSGAKYVIVKNYSSSNHYALVNTPDAEATNYLDGTKLATDCEAVREEGSLNDRFKLKVVPTADMIWQVKRKGTHWVIYSPDADKYLKITSDGYTQLTSSCEDEFILTTYGADSQIDAESTNATGKHLSWHNSSPGYWQGYGSDAAKVYWMTNNEEFSSNPPCTPRSVTFYGNGGTVTDGENEDGTLVVTEANRGDGITTPTAAMDGADCNGNTWEFLGWLNRELAKTRIPVLTTDLLNDGGGNKPHTIQADDEEYYAVYYNTDKPETKYGTITLNKNDIGQNYVNSEQTTTKTVASMGDYTFGYVDLGHQSSIGMQFESGLGELYNKTSLGKINSISFTNFTAGGVSNLRVYVGDEEHTTDHLLGNAEMQHIDGSNTWTYYPSDNYPYVYIKDNSGYVNVQSISIEFGKGATVYATTPDCSLRVTYKAAGEDDYVVEIGESDPHNLPAYYPAGCGNKEFIGWAEAGIPALQQTAPTIATADGSLTNVHSIKTLYAVYAVKNGHGEQDYADNFNSYEINLSYQNTTAREYGIWSVLNGTVSELSNVISTMGSKAVILQWNNNGTTSTMTTKDKVKGFSGIDCQIATTNNDVYFKIQYSADSVSWTDWQPSTNHPSYRQKMRYSLSMLAPQDVYVRFYMTASATGASLRVYIDDVTLYSEPHPWYYTDYSTTCETESAPVDLTWENEGGTIATGTEPATSALGNWLTLPTLSKDNYRFDGWKATINGDQKADVYLGGETFLINHPVTFTAQWTELFEVSGPTAGVTSYKDISITSSETFTVTTKGTHSITPVVYGLSDNTHFAVTITTPGTNNDDDTDFSCTFTYTPDDFGTGSGAATHTATFRFKDEASGAVSEPVTIRGRSLPEEFVIAVKNNNKWYALPSNLQNTNSQPAIVPVEITVNDPTTPTAALLAPQTALYKATAPYQNTHTTALRFTATGSNYLQVSGVEGTYNMWLSNSGGTNVQDWQLYSTNFNAYELTIPSHDYPTKKMGIYDGSYMGYHTSPSNSQIYLLPVTAAYTPRDAKVKEWGRYSVVVEVETTNIATVKAHIDNAAPTAALTPQPVNVATIAGAKNLLINTVDAIDFSAQEGHSLYLDWYNASNELIASSQISVPLIIAGNTTMSSIDNVKTHWEKKEVHVLPGVKLTADANTFASGNVTVKTLEVYPNATLHISAGTLNATNLHLRGGWTRANGKDYDVARVYIDPSAALTKTHAAMYYDIFDSDEGKHYYPLAVPFDVPVNTIDYADEYLAGFSTYGTHYIIKTYDGALRAEYGVIDDAWAAVASDGTLQAGRGYIITAVAVKGDAVIRIPLSFDNAWTAAGEKATVSAVTKNVVPVVAHTGTASTGESANNRRHAGWNMLGVPFMSCYTAGTDMYATDALIKGEIVIVGGSEGYAYQNTTVPYVSVPTHNFAEYIQTDITEAKLVPGWGFFVQVGTSGNLTFLANKQREDSDTPLYAPQRNDKDQTGNRAALVLAGKGCTDKTTLIISDRYNASYEIGADLEKMFGNGNTLATYTIMEDGTRLVFNALGNKEIANSVPVGFRVPAAGEYTFSLDDSYPTEQFERIDLIDYQQGTLTNLLENNYTFTTEGTQNDSRFALNAELRRLPLIPTATDNVSDNGNQVEKRIVDGYLIIIRNGRIYDATGKLKVTTVE